MISKTCHCRTHLVATLFTNHSLRHVSQCHVPQAPLKRGRLGPWAAIVLGIHGGAGTKQLLASEIPFGGRGDGCQDQARFHRACKHFQVSQCEEGHPRGFSIEKTGKSQSYLSLNAIRLQNKTNKFRGSLPLEAAAWMFFLPRRNSAKATRGA